MELLIYPNDFMTPKDGIPWMNVHVIGNHHRRITDFQGLVDELQKHFPQARTEDIELGIITKSECRKNFIIVRWGGYIKDEPESYPAFQRCTNREYECV